MENYSKIKDAQKQSLGYDLMEIVLVRKVADPMASVLQDQLGNETVNLFED
jgi:hypothetical protein